MSVRLIDNTDKVVRGLREQAAQGVNNAAQFWSAEAQDLAPVATGYLKANIGQTVVATSDSPSAEIRSAAPYSGFVNYGTSKMQPQPFWTVAGLMTQDKFKDLLKSGSISISRGSSIGNPA